MRDRNEREEMKGGLVMAPSRACEHRGNTFLSHTFILSTEASPDHHENKTFLPDSLQLPRVTRVLSGSVYYISTGGGGTGEH